MANINELILIRNLPWLGQKTLESGGENMSTSLPSVAELQGNLIWIKDIHVFQKGLEGCSVFSNNRNASGVDLHCPLPPSSPPLCPQPEIPALKGSRQRGHTV